MQEIPTINLGKHGVTENFIKEVDLRLKKNKKVRIKMLKSSDRASKNELATSIAKKVNAYVVVVRGFTFILQIK